MITQHNYTMMTSSQEIFKLDAALYSVEGFIDTNKPPLNLLLIPKIKFLIHHSQLVPGKEQDTRLSESIDGQNMSVKFASSPYDIPHNDNQPGLSISQQCHHSIHRSNYCSRQPYPCHHDHHSGLRDGSMTYCKARKYEQFEPDTKSARFDHDTSDSNTDDSGNHLKKINRGWTTPEVLAPQMFCEAIREWLKLEGFTRNAREAELNNPFGGIDMNKGWNRAKTQLLMHFNSVPERLACLDGGAARYTTIQEQFASFSLWDQLDCLQLGEPEMKAMGFIVVFKGVGRGCGWARKPGSWTPRKKGLAGCCKEGCFWTCNKRRLADILYRVYLWYFTPRPEGDGGSKRERVPDKDPTNNAFQVESKKRLITRSGQGRLVSEDWRARRREQEKRAGRWTDGTVRMDRLWDGFYWVLNSDDPLKCRWNHHQMGWTNLWV